MKLTHKFALSVCVIFSILSLSGCQGLPVWDWKNDPFSASREGYIINSEGKIVKMDSTEIEDFTCFSSKDMESLKVNIDRVKAAEKAAKEYLE